MLLSVPWMQQKAEVPYTSCVTCLKVCRGRKGYVSCTAGCGKIIQVVQAEAGNPHSSKTQVIYKNLGAGPIQINRKETCIEMKNQYINRCVNNRIG